MVVDTAALMLWLPNSGEFSADSDLLEQCLESVVADVGERCRYLGATDPGDGTQAPTSEWPMPVATATLMFAADLVAARNRPGVLEFGTYVPKNHAAERLLSPYRSHGF